MQVVASKVTVYKPRFSIGWQAEESKITNAFVSHLHTLSDLKLCSSAPSDSVLG